MATQGTSGEDSPTPPSKRERKPNIRLGDLGESKPSSRQLRARKPRSTGPSPDSGTKKQTETPSCGPKRSSPRSADPSPGSGTEKQKETPESEPKRPKPSIPRNRPSTEPSPNSGTEKQKETHKSDPKCSKPSTILKRRSTEPSPNSGKQLKTPDSVFKPPHDKPPADNLGTEYGMEITLSELKRPRDKSPANNSAPKNQQESSNGPARGMISGSIMDINVSRGAHDVAAKANDCISQNGGSRLAEMGGVHGWLEWLGLAKYKRTFDSHEVDETALPLLTVKDLINMGITAVGSRRKLYCAIQELKKGL
ncbi:ankyrin repeat and SAM domain-containing protein 6-like protein [Carex littledalei]|uniref:Ankyrin repeat and SAM domain-containing protein 6-like protein n=1 Tax=Carex littledalei TaxID=544730 RepID=A0A833R760_9POAL|nr:ankyrin repeat and SAM domain-containing protein 6-like protein [Carex littledalei]